MARLFYVTKDKYGFRYRENQYMGWNHCPDSVQNRDSLESFLTQNGRYNGPSIVFTDDKGAPVRIYEVTKNNGSVLAIVDGKDKMPLVRQHFLSDVEAADWFKTLEVSETTINEADSKATAQDRLKHYQDNANTITQEMYEQLCSEKMSDSNIKTFLQADATARGVGAEVIFK
jgi:hypothetical protein